MRRKILKTKYQKLDKGCEQKDSIYSKVGMTLVEIIIISMIVFVETFILFFVMLPWSYFLFTIFSNQL